MNLVNKNECCIPQEYLLKYGVLTNIETSGTVKRLIDQCDLKEIRHTQLYNVVHQDDNAHKNEYFLHPFLFKYILIRSKNTNVYAQYYLLLEECISHYSQYQILSLLHKIKQNNKVKLLHLQNSKTLDNFIIFYDKNRHIYKYGTIKGSDKNIKETLFDLNLSENNIILRLMVPSQNNFQKAIKEELGEKYDRQRFYIRKSDKKKITGYDDDFVENDDYVVCCSRFFKLNDISEEDFLIEIRKINLSRFNE